MGALSLRLPDYKHERLRALAKSKGVSINNLFGERRVFHRPHPTPTTDKGALASLRDWLQNNGVKP